MFGKRALMMFARRVIVKNSPWPIFRVNAGLQSIEEETGQWAPINFHGLYMEWTLLILALCMACTIILAFIGVNPDLIGLSPMIQRQHFRAMPRFISQMPDQLI